MAMLTDRVSAGTEEELEAIAQSRGSTKSNIARGTLPPDGETDDFAEFGDAVRHANRRVLSGLFETLLDTVLQAEWDAVVEPAYQLFKARVVKQSEDHGVPRLSHWCSDAAFLSAPICFAAQDDFNRVVPLHELIYQYGKEDGEEAMDHVRAAVAQAEMRLAQGEAG